MAGISVYRPELETAAPDVIERRQLDRLQRLFDEILPANRFYAARLGALPRPAAIADLAALPFTTKADLVADQRQAPPFGTLATYEIDRYVARHQTSGTTGEPLAVPDSRESWDWWIECWQYVYRAAGVSARDRVFCAFSFGPFIGFWSAFEAARRLGALAIPGGGMDSKARLETIRRTEATVLLSTPTYALHLADVARAADIPLADSSVRTTIHAGEPGASVESVRDRIERAWGARCFDHAGATEVGAFGYACSQRAGLHLNEAEFITEILDPATGTPVGLGELGELVITNLGRAGWPAIRYRTGDVVRNGGRGCACGRTFRFLPGGVVGRTDDLMIVRGVNVFPSALEAIVRTFAIEEFRIVRTREEEMEELTLEIEADDDLVRTVAEACRQALGVRIATRGVARGSLPRWELKARRVVDRRS